MPTTPKQRSASKSAGRRVAREPRPDPSIVARLNFGVVVVAVVLLLCFALQAFYAAREDSVTIDEFAHLPVGLYMLRTGDFAPDPINPPLTRMIAALPLLSTFSFVQRSAAADEFVEIDGWILKRSDLRQRDAG